MKIINSYKDLIDKINFNNHIISNSTIEIENINLYDIIGDILFENCLFKTKILFIGNINDENLSINFKDCNFEGIVEVKNCTLHKLSFENTSYLKELFIYSDYNDDCQTIIDKFIFKNEGEKIETSLDTNFNITNSSFNAFEFFNINHCGEYFNFSNNIIGDKNHKSLITRQCFENSWICNAKFNRNQFYEKTSFFRSFFTLKAANPYTKATRFNKNIFSEVSFENTTFYDTCIFEECSFFEKSNFYNLNNYSTGNLSFHECVFSGRVDFEAAKANYLSFIFCQFEQTVSFSYTMTEIFLLERNIFIKAAYFDAININNISNCNRRTLRTIKQELQKAENRIDYNRFRSYELAAYYQELNWKWNKGFKDKLILGATILFTGFDHSWRRALAFTLLIGFSLYALFFVSENYMLQRDFSQWQEFLSGYFRFLIVTDFYNPLAEGRTYIDNTNTIGWLIFIFGKIVIAFGIYEMIQAFRKFKA